MTIRTIYKSEPDFPASDQHPDAQRYRVDGVWVDAIGGEPSVDEVRAILSPASTAEDVKAEAARRIEAIMPMWMVAREVSGGEPIPDEIKAAVAAIRKRSGEIEAFKRIPRDLSDDKHWPS